MGLFYNNNVAGKGVSKNTAPKKPFARFRELFFAKFWTLFRINLVYFLFCIPIVTFGPATAAMTSLMRDIYLGRPIFVFHDFFKQFKKNFKQSFFIGILDVAAMAGLYFCLYQFAMLEERSTENLVLMGVCVAAEVLFLLVNFYIYPQIVAVDINLGAIFKNAVILMFVNLGGELISLVFFVGYAILAINFPIIVLVLFPFLPAAGLAFLSVFCCYPAIQKFLINPYYEKSGEKNPELPDDSGEEALFQDMGGTEAPIDARGDKGRSGKVIK